MDLSENTRIEDAVKDKCKCGGKLKVKKSSGGIKNMEIVCDTCGKAC